MTSIIRMLTRHARLLALLIASMATLSVFAQDTLSTADVVFTDIHDSTQSLRPDSVAGIGASTAQAIAAPVTTAAHQSLWGIFLAGLLGGFAAVLMPCIFPMLPMTVSFFTKEGAGKKAIGKALTYGLSIIVIYISLGLLITLLFGADALNAISTNGLFNIFFFLLLVVFAASFLGAFEIVLPAKWVNMTGSKAGNRGIGGLFFMAATLSLVSFSCTGPIIGTLLVEAATTGALLGPAIGMLGFSIALALPFTLFALFPAWLSSLPRSGGWLNSVKVTLGFLELALALKFLSNVDLAYHWNWFDREIFLSLWIILFGLLGCYLLGKIRFAHDSPLSHLSIPRLFLAIICLSFTLYLVPGLWGAPLKSVSAFLPPMSTQDFDLTTPREASPVEASGPRKYASLFEHPKGFAPYFDYEEGLAYARKSGKPVMIDFTGHACVNCRKMEANVWPDPRVAQTINKDYVLIQLYVDDKTTLPAAEQSTLPGGQRLTSIGKKWSHLQMTNFKANSQPYYVLLDPATQQPLVPPQGANYDSGQYLEYLHSGLSAWKSKHP